MRWLPWHGRVWPLRSRTAAVRELMQKMAAEMKADGVQPPRVRYRLPDGREHLPSLRPFTQWERYQARVQDRLRNRG